MRDDDPFAPPPKRDTPIELMSIADLEARIEALKAEIGACERAIAAKRAQRAAAEGLFGLGGQA